MSYGQDTLVKYAVEPDLFDPGEFSIDEVKEIHARGEAFLLAHRGRRRYTVENLLTHREGKVRWRVSQNLRDNVIKGNGRPNSCILVEVGSNTHIVGWAWYKDVIAWKRDTFDIEYDGKMHWIWLVYARALRDMKEYPFQ